MAVADHIVDSISSTNNNNNSNNNGEFDDDLKRVSEVLESSKACVFQHKPFSLKKLPAPKTRTPKKKRSPPKKCLVLQSQQISAEYIRSPNSIPVENRCRAKSTMWEHMYGFCCH